MKLLDIDFFAPEGLLLSNDDAFRKFGGAYILGRIKKEGGPDEIVPMRIEGLVDPLVTYSTDSSETKRGLRSFIRLAAPFPISGVCNHADGVLRCFRDGARQWQYGVGTEGFKVFYETIDSSPVPYVNFAVVKSLYKPEYTPFKEAFALLNSKGNKVVARAINPRYWIKRTRISDRVSQIVLFRKAVPVGAFMSADPESLYMHQSCLALNDELKQILGA